MGIIDLDDLKRKAKDKHKENTKFLKRIKKLKPKNLDIQVQEIHESVFTKINCLECANCCKTISPMITYKDVDKIAKHLKMKPADVVQEYMHIDEDGDYVFNQSPCPFLLPDNYCLIYESRPKACAGYPHTDRKKFHQLLDITTKNLFICPAVFQIIENLKRIY